MENTHMIPISEVLNPPIADQEDSQPNYQRTYSVTSPKQTGYLRKRRPLVRAQRTPDEIIGTNYEAIKKTLMGWAKARERVDWKEFAEKMSPEYRDMLSETFSELRRHGYFNPKVRFDKIVVDYACYHIDVRDKPTHGLCLLCERECEKKDWKGVFKTDHKGDEVKKCWE